MIKTITLNTNQMLQFTSDPENVRIFLNDNISNIGRVLTVTRPFFSTKYVVTLDTSVSDQTLIETMLAAFQVQGYNNVSLDSISGGYTSPDAGGLPSLTGTVEKLGSSTLQTLAIVGVAAIVIIYLIERRS